MIPNKETDDSWLLIHEAVVLGERFLVLWRNTVPSFKGWRDPARTLDPWSYVRNHSPNDTAP